MRKANQALSQRGSVRVAGRVPKLTKLYLTAWEKRYMIMAAGRAGAKEMKRTVQGTQRPRGSWGETERRIGRGRSAPRRDARQREYIDRSAGDGGEMAGAPRGWLPQAARVSLVLVCPDQTREDVQGSPRCLLLQSSLYPPAAEQRLRLRAPPNLSLRPRPRTPWTTATARQLRSRRTWMGTTKLPRRTPNQWSGH